MHVKDLQQWKSKIYIDENELFMVNISTSQWFTANNEVEINNSERHRFNFFSKKSQRLIGKIGIDWKFSANREVQVKDLQRYKSKFTGMKVKDSRLMFA